MAPGRAAARGAQQDGARIPVRGPVGPIDYPDSYGGDLAPRFIDQQRTVVRDPAVPDDASRWEWNCLDCAFRPWLDAGDAERVVATITGAAGAGRRARPVRQPQREPVERRELTPARWSEHAIHYLAGPMLHVVVRCMLAAVLLAAAGAKVARPGESRDALRGLVSWLPLPVLVAIEVALAAGVAAGLDAVALAASIFMLGAAAVLGRALSDGREGAPCGCFGARSKVSRLAVVRNLVLAAAFGVLPFVPRTDPSDDAWLAIGLGIALLAVVVLTIVVLALAREVGMLRLAVGPQSALEVPEEGPPVGADSGLAGHLDPRVDPTALGLAVFTSDGCRLCRQLEPAIRALGRDPHVSLVELDEVRDADQWRRLDIPGSPFAVALGVDGRVLAKGTFNSLPQLESVLATAERRRREHTGV